MKKIFLFFAAALMTLSFASCDGGNNTPKDEAFKIEISNIEARKASVVVTPADTAVTYYWDLLEAAQAAKMTDAEVAAYFKEYFDYVIDYYAEYEWTYADLLIKGTENYDFSGLDPDTEYTVVAIALTANIEAAGTAVKKTFKTLEVHEDPVPADMTFQIEVDGITFNSAAVAITPSTDASTYYWNIFGAEDIAGMSDADIKATIKDNLDYMIEYYTYYGYDVTIADFLSQGPDAYEFEDLSANTAYTIVAVAMGTEGTINGALAKRTFQTAEVVATDSLELDLVSEYTFYEEYNVIQILGEDAEKNLELGLTFETTEPTGTYTLADCYEDGYYYWNYIYNSQTEEIVEFVDLYVTGVLQGSEYIYSGYGIAEDGIKYIFTDVHATEYVPQEEAPAKANKKGHEKKDFKAAKKGNFKKEGKFVSRKAFDR